MSGIEILGIAASVVQIADLGGRLSVKLFTFSRKIKNADKSIDIISRDIAATGAVLQQLGKELEKDDQLRLCSIEAVSTARDLVEDCNRVFVELDDALGGRGSHGRTRRLVAGWKDRIRFPFLEAHIELLRSNLERLKSSLLVMLNVLIFAEQLRNRETVPSLQDQRELIKTLVEDKATNEQRFERVCKTLEGLSMKDEAPAAANAVTTMNNMVTVRAFSPVVDGTSSRALEPTHPVPLHPLDLPAPFKDRKEEIDNHFALVTRLLREVSDVRYRIDDSVRERMHHGVLELHWEEWSSLESQHTFIGFKDSVTALFSSNPTVVSKSSIPATCLRVYIVVDCGWRRVYRSLMPFKLHFWITKLEGHQINSLADEMEREKSHVRVVSKLRESTTNPTLMEQIDIEAPSRRTSLMGPDLPNTYGRLSSRSDQKNRSRLRSDIRRHRRSHNEHTMPNINHWTMSPVLLWLAENDFSIEWQETFKQLDLQGADFLQFGQSYRWRNNTLMDRLVMPELVRQCSKSSTGWNQSEEQKEGKRMWKLLQDNVDLDREPVYGIGLAAKERPDTLADESDLNEPRRRRSEPDRDGGHITGCISPSQFDKFDRLSGLPELVHVSEGHRRMAQFGGSTALSAIEEALGGIHDRSIQVSHSENSIREDPLIGHKFSAGKEGWDDQVMEFESLQVKPEDQYRHYSKMTYASFDSQRNNDTSSGLENDGRGQAADVSAVDEVDELVMQWTTLTRDDLLGLKAQSTGAAEGV